MESYTLTAHLQVSVSEVLFNTGRPDRTGTPAPPVQTNQSWATLQRRPTCLQVFAFETALASFLLRGGPRELRGENRTVRLMLQLQHSDGGVIFTLDSRGCIIFTTIFILCLRDPIITAFILPQTLGSHISLVLGCADIGEVESEENLPGANVQHVVFFAEVQGGEVEDSTGWKASGRPLLRVWTQTHKWGGGEAWIEGLDHGFFSGYSEREEDSIKYIMTNKSHYKLVEGAKSRKALEYANQARFGCLKWGCMNVTSTTYCRYLLYMHKSQSCFISHDLKFPPT